MDFETFISPILISLKIVAVSSILVTLLGFAAAWFMARKHFVGRTALDTLFMLPLVLPPTVVGFVLLTFLGRQSWAGRLAEWLFQQPLVFTWGAAVLAGIVMAFPLVYQTMKVGFLSVDDDLEDAGRSMGASEWQVLRFITLPLVWRSLMTAYLLGFARGLGEFGATLMVAGNIPGRTQTVPTAIYLAVETGQMTAAWYWTFAIALISFGMLFLVNRRVF